MKLSRTPRRRHRLLEMIRSRAARAMGCPFERTGSPLSRGPGRPLRAVPYALPDGKKTAGRVQIRTALKLKLDISVLWNKSAKKYFKRQKVLRSGDMSYLWHPLSTRATFILSEQYEIKEEMGLVNTMVTGKL